MKEPLSKGLLDLALEQTVSQPDRGAAIVACAVVEELLTEAIISRLILTDKIRNSLFGRSGALEAFSNKIDMAYAIGLLNREHHSDLNIIRRVRNRFAHEVAPLEFTDQQISDWLKNLSSGAHIENPRQRYMAAMSAFAMLFLVEATFKGARLPHLFGHSGFKDFWQWNTSPDTHAPPRPQGPQSGGQNSKTPSTQPEASED